MANHLDNDETDIEESNYMTNILPQAAGFNQAGGAWIETEDIIECGRDIAGVEKQVSWMDVRLGARPLLYLTQNFAPFANRSSLVEPCSLMSPTTISSPVMASPPRSTIGR